MGRWFIVTQEEDSNIGEQSSNLESANSTKETRFQYEKIMKSEKQVVEK
jgi:hypothetical protein